ncbi:MAG: hypothetical protein K2X00_20990 [Nitrospiraceae bacterium]|nr:hypothetical protein [Nitrospiraceae bacterium]
MRGYQVGRSVASDESGQVRTACHDSAGGMQVEFFDSNAVSESAFDGTLRARYEWPGREYDADVGLQYNRARCYDPQPGRLIEPS